MNPLDLLRTPGDADIIWRVMESLIPSGQTTGFSIALGTFAGSLTFFGSLLIGYLIITGIVSSAHSGKVLGDRYHQIWAPLRIVLGIGLLVPLAFGFSGVHYLTKEVFKAGVNLGNATANVAVEYVVTEGHPLAPIAIAGRTLARQIAMSEVCHAVHAGAYQRTSAFVSETPPPPRPEASGGIVVKPGRKSWMPWVADTQATIQGVAWDYGQACGAVTFSAPTVEEFGSFHDDRRDAVRQLIEDVRAIGAGEAIAAGMAKSGTNLQFDVSKPEANLRHIQQWVRDGYLAENLLQRINDAGDRFDTTIAQSAAENGKAEDVEARRAVVEGVKEHGWYLLGSYYRMLARVSEKSSSYAGEAPVRVEPNPEAWGGYHNEVAVALNLVNAQIKAEAYVLVVRGDQLADIGTEAGVLAKVTNSISGPVLDYLTGYDGFRPDPVGDLINIGNRLLGGAQMGFTAGLAASGVAGAPSTISHAAMKVFDFAMVPGWWLIGGSFIAGAVLTYVLPMMPLIFLTFALVVLAMEVVAFAISCLLWAFRHIGLSGEEFVSQEATPGYQILFSLMLRQPITVLGFLGAHAISVAVFNAFLMVWNLGFIGNQGASSIGLVGILIGFAMMIYIQWHIQLRLFGLMLELPTRVAAMMGAAIQGWGDQEHGNTVIAGSAGGVANHGRLGKPQGSPGKPSNNSNPSGGKGGAGGGVTARR